MPIREGVTLLRSANPASVRLGQATLVVGLVGYGALLALGSGSGGAGPLEQWLYNGLILGSGAMCLARGFCHAADRAAWSFMGVGVIAWGLGEVHFGIFSSHLADPPFLTLADAFYLVLYPASYVALVLLLRARFRRFRRGLWLDGLIATLAVIALATTLFGRALEASGGRSAAVVTNLAYPLGDVLLLAIIVGGLALTGWRPERTLVLLGIALAIQACADAVYLVQVADGSYDEGAMLDWLWPASAVFMAFGAWQQHRPARVVEAEGWRIIVAPFAFGLLAIVLLAASDHLTLHPVALGASAATLVAVLLRMASTFRENLYMLAESRHESLTDALTDLGNRRKLMLDLEAALSPERRRNPNVLVLFDLDGFKYYNDSFGHPAGDALLRRLGDQLGAAVRPHGTSYRLGGDEFCALFPVSAHDAELVTARAVAALREHGEGFAVDCSYGSVVVPDEADELDSVLQLADRRLYARKYARRASTAQQTLDVLLQVLAEREPSLRHHLAGVTDLAVAVGERMELSSDELHDLARAAGLHDVGKVAVPEAILAKPGPLDESEWEFIRQHTLVGERILSAAPALRTVAPLVRASHERYDGYGYPDELAGDAIPLGARIIAVCGAFHAMTTERPYQPVRPVAEALDELRRCAGTQFDPDVVDALVTVVSGGGIASRRITGSAAIGMARP